MSAIPHNVIIRSFFWPYSAEFIAAGLRAMFHQPMTAARLEDLWIEESAWNPFLRMDRPKDGFKQTEEIKFWEKLAVADDHSNSNKGAGNETDYRCIA